ncbi:MULTISPECIES: hypothetical protein [unclassified Shinella]|uniref:hypothetical protein n=1 Tax=unclassified Shinella TaxID=2643062 RepID=UPI00225D9EBA|nr:MULTISPECIES: hypothetical protein [unclassified Shinella]MCO5141390.1 hypothetical protein [Shinella sp.]MDC7256407.1 hypothetical protein [Shinella sp. YE25]CAI0339270.1 conserved hypothetical protein [Rhizobiaceae bacterium]CAK7257681.1 SMI1/KNR4 family protein [Shinella sp. WSC3-e]
MKLLQPRFLMDIPERSNAGGGGAKRVETVWDEAQEISKEEARQIDCEPGGYKQRDQRWYASYGVKVPDEFRRFLVRTATHLAKSEKRFVYAPAFFKSLQRDEFYPIPLRSLQDWCLTGKKLGYLSVAEAQIFAAPSLSGRDTCIYFTALQKTALMTATGADQR